MPRNYIRRKPEIAPVTQQQIDKAKLLIQKGMSQRAAADHIGISESCLRKRLKLGNTAFSMGRFKPTFNDDQEAEFAIHCKKMDERYFGLTINDLRRLAYEYATSNKIENRFDKSSKMAGRDWVEGFLKRHPRLVVRQSAATSLARAMGFNKIQVERFYTNLKVLYEKYKFKPNRIYNVDETGMSTVPKKTPKVITTKGKKVVSKIVSAERGTTVTAICCMSACGHYIPPALIYPRKRPRDDLLDGGPSQSICMVSDSGFVNTELFLNWLHHFKYFVHPAKEDPVLLLLDNHSSHISLEVVKYARDNNIVMLTLPPHGSHKLQPLDRCLYSPLKVKYSIECDKYMSQHPGRAITQYQVARLFNEAYKKVATLGNADSGFKVTGIYPFDDNLFDETDFAPSFVTDQMTHEENTEERQTVDGQETTQSIEPSTSQSLDVNQAQKDAEAQIAGEESSASQEQQIVIAHDQIELQDRDNISSNENEIQGNAPNINLLREDATPSPSIFDLTEEAPAINEMPVAVDHCTEACSYHPQTSNVQGPSVKEIINRHVSVAQLSPLPKMKEKRRGGKVSMKSQIITDSPYKQQLEERKSQEETKKMRKRKVPTFSLKTTAKKNKPSQKQKAPTTYSSSKQKPSSSKSKKRVYYCPLCKEKYEEPPIEEWIKCSACEEWWHEQCTNYEKGVFVCDNCIEN